MEAQGFPLEVRTSEVLKAHHWKLVNQYAYLDYEEQKFRTVDVVASKVLFGDKKMGINLELIIECKKTDKPWVFYASNYDLSNTETKRMLFASFQYFLNEKSFPKKITKKLDDLIMKYFSLHFKSPILGKVAYIPFEPFTKGKGRNIHKARMQVCNTILYLKQHSETIQINFPYGDILIPFIVLDGQPYAYEDGKLNAEKGFYYNVIYANSSFMIEIVTTDFLGTYLDFIGQEIEKFQAKTKEP